jgi:hypothetical protein
MIELVTVILCLIQAAYLLTVIATFGYRKLVPAPVIAFRRPYLAQQVKQDVLAHRPNIGRRVR